MSSALLVSVVLVILGTLGAPVSRLDSVALEQKIAAIVPTPAEDAFLQIPWRPNLLKARAESVRTGKPLFIWSMNGHPLGHT
jgi:hypothetical protein